nr:MFS transporter [uncultured Brevundimonas sp.]
MDTSPFPSARRSAFGAWWALAVLWLLYSLSFVDRYALSLVVEPIKADLGLTDTQMSLLLGPAFTLCYAVFGIPLGWAADRAPRRWVIFGGVVVWSVCAAGSGLARSFGAMLLARSGVGVGEASLSPSAYSILADKFSPGRLSLALSIYQTGIYVGQAGAFMLVGLILAHVDAFHAAVPGFSNLEPWRMALILTGAPGVILALLVFTFTERGRQIDATPVARDSDQTGLWSFVRANGVLIALLMTGFGLVSMCSMAMVAWTPTYIQRNFGLTPPEYAPYLSLITLGGAASLLMKGGLMDWLYKKGRKDAHVRLYTWFLIGSAPAIYLAYAVGSPLLFFPLYAVLVIVTIPFMVFLVPAIQIFTPPAYRARMSAAFLFAVTIIGSLGPVLVGALSDQLFSGPARLGHALALVIGLSMPATLLLLHLAMPRLRKVM